MARRIEIELTSARDDGSYTWRAAGAREPRGVIQPALVPAGSTVGAVLRVEVEIGLDGTDITAVLPPKAARAEPERLEIMARDLREDELVTSKLVGKRGGRDRDGDRRGGRGRDGERRGGRDGGRGGRDGGRPSGDRRPSGREGGRPGGESRPGGDRARGGDDRRSRGGERARRRPEVDARPKPKRLRPHRTHRKAVLDALELHERPIAEEVLRGGIPAVRQAVERQNEQAKAEGRPPVDPAQLEALAERLLPRLRTAEWRDRAEAALADLAELDLRDLRTVVVAADSAAKDDETRALAAQLREGLERRIEADQAAWLAELAQLLSDGRVVRALRVSSRPPKAGAPLPVDLATRLTEASNASLTADTPTDRWSTVLDALSLSPVHARVAPESIPAEPSEELKKTVAAYGSRTPLVAAAFGIEPAAAPPRRGPRRGPRAGASSKPVPPPPAKPAAPAPDTSAARPEPAAETSAPVDPAASEATVATEGDTPPAEPAAPAPDGGDSPSPVGSAPEPADEAVAASDTTPVPESGADA